MTELHKRMIEFPPGAWLQCVAELVHLCMQSSPKICEINVDDLLAGKVPPIVAVELRERQVGVSLSRKVKPEEEEAVHRRLCELLGVDPEQHHSTLETIFAGGGSGYGAPGGDA